MARVFWLVTLPLAAAMVSAQDEQSKVTLDDPIAVAVGVRDMVWEDRGAALLWDGNDADGPCTGLWNKSTGRGKVVFRNAGKGEVMSRVWLNGRPVLLQVLSEPVSETHVRLSLWALDSINLSSRQLWAQDFAKDTNPELQIERSPTRPHAIVTVSTTAGTRPFVVTEGAQGMLYSRDIEAAERGGMGFVGWSADGTAYFMAGAAASSSRLFTGAVRGRFVLDQVSDATVAYLEIKSGKSTIPVKFAGDASGRFEQKLGDLMLVMSPAVAPGTAVNELVASNGALRPVRAKAMYVDTTTPRRFGPELNRHTLAKDDGTGDTQGLWLVFAGHLVPADGAEKAPGNVKPIPPVLVSADAEEAWLAPVGRAVAYVRSGALFVRTFSVR